MLDLQEAAAKAVSERRSISGFTCPKCHGGQKRERSVTVFPKKGSALVAIAHCWRNKCDFNEEILGHGKPAISTWRPATEPPTIPLTEKALQYIERRFRLHSDTLYRWSVTQLPWLSSVYLPAFDVRHERIGGVLRHLGKHTGSKAVVFQTKQVPFMAFYLRRPCSHLVVVEDQLSAMRAWQLGVSAAALVGVALSDEKLNEVRKAGPQRMTIALDADATGRAIRYARRYGAEVVRLWRDLKDSTDKEIQECLKLSTTY